MTSSRFSLERTWAIILKEFILMKRDPAVIIIMAIFPLLLVLITGLTVNINPKHVPTVFANYSDSDITRDFILQLKNSQYFKFVKQVTTPEEATQALKTGAALLAITIPENFTRDLMRGQRPEILIEDGSLDFLSTGRALASLPRLKQYFLASKLPGALSLPNHPNIDFKISMHRLYNPDYVSQYDVIPGIISFILMMTMLMIAIVVAFRDIQGGTIECLLASPTHPTEILFAEILSYIFIGYVQLSLGLILLCALFKVAFLGSVFLLFLCALPFIIAELSLGLCIATFCASQFEAIQVANIFIALSITLTGFIFPIFSMPHWAQVLSVLFPITHFLKILRGIMLKDNGFHEIWNNLWPLTLYCFAMIAITVGRFQRYYR